MFASLGEDVGKQAGMERVIERQLLQRLLDSFSTATRLFVAVTDVDGEVILTSRQGDCEFCRLVKEDPVGRERCRGSYARAGKQAKRWNEPYFFRCHAGLIAWACPILMNDNHVGNMICGHVLMWEPEELFWLEMKESISDLGQDSEVLLGAARKLEVVSATQAQAAADLLFIIANYLAKAGTELFDYQRKLREVGSWLWEENYRRGDAVRADGSEAATRFFDLERRFFAEIRQTNIEKARKLLESLALELFTRSKGQIEVIKGSCIEFIGSLARLATECGIKFEKSFRFDMLKLNELEEADTVEKVFLWLLSTGNAYIDLLAGQKEDEGEAVINKAVAYIENNYSSPDLSLEEISKNCYISPAYLSRLFKKKKGYTLMEHIRNVRIDRAKILLQDRDRTMSEIARSVGYSDRTYFCKIFKQVVGLSPNEYRKKFLLR
ncbi:PocR ligand-binding domain-containing protein [Thermacetogenium phaeum]|nr:PocR ligand-binding domain-containing protein [Thermacetogenium phaeum]